MFRPLTILTAAALLASPAPASSADLDKGSFKIFHHEKALGAETFEIREQQDSLLVSASQYLSIPSSQGEDPVQRTAQVVVRRTDFTMREYRSSRTRRGTSTSRGLVLADTHYVAYREDQRGGVGESRVLPPGRLYVMDSQLITLFDLLCRSFHARSFTSRPINLLALGPRDTLLAAEATVLPSETIRWGAKPVVARKLQIVADSRTTFTLWVGAQGQLLRLSEPVGGLRAERDAPEVKPRAASKPKPAG